MHQTALEFGHLFFNTYVAGEKGLSIVDIGSQDITGSLRSVAPPESNYLGIDFAAGKGIDIIISDPYCLPVDDNSADVVVSSSCFEHSEFFWLVYNEILRILKPSGIFYLNAPSNGHFHRYPVDCWRFYPDSGVAQNWGKRSGYANVLLESFIGPQKNDIWNDFVAVFLRDVKYIGRYPKRMQESRVRTCGQVDRR
jgi:SAM-dependent methyltransferase